MHYQYLHENVQILTFQLHKSIVWELYRITTTHMSTSQQCCRGNVSLTKLYVITKVKLHSFRLKYSTGKIEDAAQAMLKASK